MSDPTKIVHMFEQLLDIATKVGFAAAALFLAWAGFLYMTAGGSPRKMESAKDAAFAAIGGLAIVLLASTIAGLVQSAIGAPATTPPTGP
jgi:Type IV secretion system pilin